MALGARTESAQKIEHLVKEESVPQFKSFLRFLLLSALIASPAMAQRRVAGRVTDQATGQPVPGAAIQVQGTQLGTSASYSGTFVLLTPDGPATLIVRRIGYQRREIVLPPGDARPDVSFRRDIYQAGNQVTLG